MSIVSFILSVFISLNIQAIAQGGDIFTANIVNNQGYVVGQKSFHDFSVCGELLGPQYIVEELAVPTPYMMVNCSTRLAPKGKVEWPGSEVRTIVHQGPSSNRIDLVIVGDGYTEVEKQKFFDDAEKITQDLFGNDTFATYLPLFNVFAVFVPSVESGIGDGRPKDTALKLYRNAVVRQAIMPGDSYTAQKASELAPDVDYPILLANDPYYGGLGGQFAITTSSPLNLTTVLRHELGHNFGRVGEEYDGGGVYRGANFSSSKALGQWAHWLKENDRHIQSPLLISYSAPWKELVKGPLEQSFYVKGSGSFRVMFDFSSIGFETKEDVRMLVDDQTVTYDGKFNYDRNFYNVEGRLSSGKHTVSFVSTGKDDNNILSKLAIYQLPEDYIWGDQQVGGFLTYNQYGEAVGYRPTERTCLMKDMSSHRFCPICIENMWRNFLKEVSLIDSLSEKNGFVEVKTIPLKGKLRLAWADPDGKRVPELDDQVRWSTEGRKKGKWTAYVAFVSPEVRDPRQQEWSIHKGSLEVQ